MRVIASGFLISIFLFVQACNQKTEVNQQLNREIDVQHQELRQNKEILFLESKDMQEKQKTWQVNAVVPQNSSDPLISEHIKSIEHHGTELNNHIQKIQEYEAALTKQAEALAKHRVGKVSDEALMETQRILRQRQLKLDQTHERLREIHQILEESRENIAKIIDDL